MNCLFFQHLLHTYLLHIFPITVFLKLLHLFQLMTKHYFDLEVIKLRTFPAKLRSSLAVLIIVSRRPLGAGLLVLVMLAPWGKEL